MNKEIFFNGLDNIFNKNDIKTDLLNKEKYRNDWSTNFQSDPIAIVFPKEVDQVVDIIKLCNEVLQIENPPSFYNQESYIQSIKDYNYEVYDITKHKFVPIINVPKLNFKITCYKIYESCNVKWSMYKYSILTAILSILIWSAIYVIF